MEDKMNRLKKQLRHYVEEETFYRKRSKQAQTDMEKISFRMDAQDMLLYTILTKLEIMGEEIKKLKE